VDYFNGGLFANIDPIELTPPELGPLYAAANENNWSYVQPVIFGTLFESSLGKEERHALGAHFTYESDTTEAIALAGSPRWSALLDRSSRQLA
jgi:type II restriction/modification system DNA methylase subunit YeeA